MSETTGYNGNSALKGVDYKHSFTKEQLVEYIKCADDPIYFIESYCKIISLDHGLIPFKLYDYQKNFILAIHNNRKVISMQPRQSGKTQVVAAYILHYTIFNKEKNVAITANKGSASREIMSRFQQMYEDLPKWMQHGVKTWNKGDIELENKSRVFCAATSASGLRGKSINFLYIDEFAIIPNKIADDFLTATYPTISSGDTTKIVITSTPLGYNHFYDKWDEAEKGLNDFIPIRVTYQEHPNRDEKWVEEQKKLLKSDAKFAQEVLCSFIGSTDTLIAPEFYSAMNPSKYVYSKGGFDVIYEPEQEHKYVMVCDVARGVGADYSALTIIDITNSPYKVVAKFRDNKLSDFKYPEIIYRIGTQYNMADVLIEINTSSYVAKTLFDEYEYENLIFVSRNSKNGQYIGGGFGTASLDYGIMTDKKVKRVGCSTLKELIENRKLIIEDIDIISEISTFIERRGSFAADDGYNDDLVMTLVLFAWLTTQTYFTESNNVEFKKELLEQYNKQIEDDILGGFYNDGIHQGHMELVKWN